MPEVDTDCCRSTEERHLDSPPFLICLYSEWREGEEIWEIISQVCSGKIMAVFCFKIWSNSPRDHANVYSMLSIETIANFVTLI